MTHARGFTLLELCIVLIVASLALGSAAPLLRQLVELRERTEIAHFFDQSNEALIGYALTHPLSSGRGAYLPCPADTPEGSEGPRDSAGNCLKEEGYLPLATLGITGTDRPARYRVDAAFANRNIGISLGLQGRLQVCSQPDCSAKLGENLGVVLLIPGALTDQSGQDAQINRDGFDSGSGIAQRCSAISASTWKDACIYLMHEPREAGGDGGAFDDRIAWLPSGILMARLVAAERLP